jgi:hypothetical protein
MGGKTGDGFIDLGHDDLSASTQVLSSICQLELAPPTLEQKLPDRLFEFCNVLRQRRLGLVKQLGGVSHRPRMRHREENTELVQRKWGLSHGASGAERRREGARAAADHYDFNQTTAQP